MDENAGTAESAAPAGDEIRTGQTIDILANALRHRNYSGFMVPPSSARPTLKSLVFNPAAPRLFGTAAKMRL